MSFYQEKTNRNLRRSSIYSKNNSSIKEILLDNSNYISNNNLFTLKAEDNLNLKENSINSNAKKESLNISKQSNSNDNKIGTYFYGKLFTKLISLNKLDKNHRVLDLFHRLESKIDFGQGISIYRKNHE